MARTKGSVIVTDNNDIKTYLKGEYYSIYDLESFHIYSPRWLDDVLAGSGNLQAGTRPPSSYRVFCILRVLDSISTVTVADYLNVKRKATGEKLYSKRYVEYWVNTLVCANRAITHHLRGDFTLTEQDVFSNEPKPPQEYTEATVFYKGKTILAKDLHKQL